MIEGRDGFRITGFPALVWMVVLPLFGIYQIVQLIEGLVS